MTADTAYGIVGDGRLALHFRHYLELTGHRVVGWSRRSGGAAGADLEAALKDAAVVLLLINDDAIAPFAREHRAELACRTLVHCAGALRDPEIVPLHPLMTFPPERLDLDRYRAIPFVGERGRPNLREVFPRLENPYYAIAAEDRPAYHALVALAGNLTPILWERLFTVFSERFGLPRDVAGPYWAEVARRVSGPMPFARTGPLVRGDHDTVRRHLAALQGDPIEPVYAAFARAAARLLEGRA